MSAVGDGHFSAGKYSTSPGWSRATVTELEKTGHRPEVWFRDEYFCVHFENVP
jgi:hypothetical protein